MTGHHHGHIVVGATGSGSRRSSGSYYQGAAYVFDVDSLEEVAKLTASDSAEFDYFGTPH